MLGIERKLVKTIAGLVDVAHSALDNRLGDSFLLETDCLKTRLAIIIHLQRALHAGLGLFRAHKNRVSIQSDTKPLTICFSRPMPG